MKKILLIFFTIFTFIGCANETPESFAKDYVKAMFEGDADKVMPIMFGDKIDMIDASWVDAFKKSMDGIKSTTSKKGGIESIETKKAMTKMKGNNVIYLVPVKIIFKDKSSNVQYVQLRKIDGKYEIL